MNIKVAGVISTGLVIALGVVFVLPPFLSYGSSQPVLLMFEVSEKNNSSLWCLELSEILNNYDAKAVVFLSGKMAEQSPECVKSFSNNVDIGSQGYNYVSIPEIADYSEQLEEIVNGKQTIDRLGNFDSKSFSSPYGKTDQNIYSLLTKSGILADFSYGNQYNKFFDGQFIWFELKTFDAREFDSDLIPTKKPEHPIPIMIHFDNTLSVEEIDEILFDLKKQRVTLVSASDLVGYDLTVRDENE